ncbi:MAG: hypothetical protein COW00_13135 [Bdellovibrio sp. CG12_big_fil_rev_8_21_14_0_65_39_13]|nr:MAG: hypothetical protein COW78_11185 [Bdellovibrio sp. CG22_combo_CG10-13_8_21_14_all_39_27]PIQ58873.1 MAG: hypothetical protein COW00_13135 [Bdellovibrio sp. CG12_big_fil_rev_8_21_14_0_65_39_13]PIR35964.1 MAG: hypothetical protein COV37_05510 [Bdellovibrio sp. CG11_big_fil_rev_8_21_14_0_20_39_38]PJB52742.1 MAG: hypothetical protein CO099_10965 [Bdellovibrio sp. CG_4_9_14_3_um_filter_39_7]
MALFRVGAVSLPLDCHLDQDKQNSVFQDLGVGYFFEDKKWNEISNNEVYSWFQPPGPGIILFEYTDQGCRNYFFHSEKNLIDNSKLTLKSQSINNDSFVLNLLSLSSLNGLVLNLFPSLISGANCLILSSQEFEAKNYQFSHLSLTHLQFKSLVSRLSIVENAKLFITEDQFNSEFKNELPHKDSSEFTFVLSHPQISPILLNQFKQEALNFRGEIFDGITCKIENDEIFAQAPYQALLITKKNDVLRFQNEDWIRIGLKGYKQDQKIFSLAD